LVDDEPELLFSLEGLLRREFDLHTAHSGSEALAALRRGPIHVVMTDQRMPGMTGSELMARVRTEFPNVVRIIFTGYADIKAVIDAINHGGLYRYLTKPWDPDELVEVLRAATARYAEDAARGDLGQELVAYVDESVQVAENAAHASSGEPGGALSDLLQRGRRLQAELKLHSPWSGNGAAPATVDQRAESPRSS
jgi:DNA-binding NtrC family response regulator